MKKDLITHFLFATAFFGLATLVRRWFNLEYLPFWIGAVLGTILPDVDSLFYIYLLRPKEPTSQEAVGLMSEQKVSKTWDLLAKMRFDRKDLIFHTAHFQAIFVLFSFWVVTSSQSLLGKGLVLAFMLHLLIDEVTDFIEAKNIDNWFAKFPMVLDSEQRRWFLVANGAVLLVLGLLV